MQKVYNSIHFCYNLLLPFVSLKFDTLAGVYAVNGVGKDMISKIVRTAVAISGVCLLVACNTGSPKKETVLAAIKQIMPMNFEIHAISAVKDVPGLYEVQIKTDKLPVVLYVNRKADLVFSGSVIEVATKKNLTLEAQHKIQK